MKPFENFITEGAGLVEIKARWGDTINKYQYRGGLVRVYFTNLDQIVPSDAIRDEINWGVTDKRILGELIGRDFGLPRSQGYEDHSEEEYDGVLLLNKHIKIQAASTGPDIGYLEDIMEDRKYVWFNKKDVEIIFVKDMDFDDQVDIGAEFY